MTRPPATTPRRRRKRERWAVLATLALAALAGLAAARFGSPRVWEQQPAPTSSTSIVPFVDPQVVP